VILLLTITKNNLFVDLYKSFIAYVSKIRTDEMFQKFIDEAKKSRNEEYELDKKRLPTRSLLCDELDECSSRVNEVVFGGKDKLKTVYFAVLDQLKKQLEMRHSGYVNIYYKFKLLINIDNKSIDTDDIIEGAKKLQQFYETDIDENTFTQECIHFKTYMQNATEKKTTKPKFVYIF